MEVPCHNSYLHSRSMEYTCTTKLPLQCPSICILVLLFIQNSIAKYPQLRLQELTLKHLQAETLFR